MVEVSLESLEVRERACETIDFCLFLLRKSTSEILDWSSGGFSSLKSQEYSRICKYSCDEKRRLPKDHQTLVSKGITAREGLRNESTRVVSRLRPREL